MMNFVKFTLPSYTGWDSIDGGFVNCTNGVNLSIGLLYRNEELCRDILICVLDAADLSQQAQFSSAATVLGLVESSLSTEFRCQKTADNESDIAPHGIVTDGNFHG